MSDHSPEAVKHHVKIYVRVFIALAVLTVLTVAVSYLHLPLAIAVLVALLIAAFKSSLVAGFFMHLVSEKSIIYIILALAVFLFATILLFPVLSHH